jgi:hypothetical protein
MESIAVIVTVYLHPKRAGDIAKKILADEHADKKLIIAVDGETNMDIEAALDPWRGQAEILYSGASIGKTASLESACSGRSEDILLFLDNDVLLPDDRAFLSKLAGRMRAGDIIDLPKEAIGKGLIAHMIGLEFMTSAISQQILASVARRCPAVMGAAFGVRRSTFEKIGGFRRVAYEDLDFGARAFRQHARFVFDRNLKVGTDVPETLVEWLGQRKRWALGNIQWLREYFLVPVLSIIGLAAIRAGCRVSGGIFNSAGREAYGVAPSFLHARRPFQRFRRALPLVGAYKTRFLRGSHFGSRRRCRFHGHLFRLLEIPKISI